MALYVKTNTSAINSQRRLNTATKSLDTTYQRLSSGLRINSAKDDAAGLQISDRLTSQINGLGQGNRNANDGIALCQTMEGALDETTSMLQRIRTLAIQAANGTNTTNDRQAIQEEVAQLSAEITRIACKTTFAGRQCIAGVGGADKGGVLDSKGKVSFQVGAYAFDTLGIPYQMVLQCQVSVQVLQVALLKLKMIRVPLQPVSIKIMACTSFRFSQHLQLNTPFNLSIK